MKNFLLQLVLGGAILGAASTQGLRADAPPALSNAMFFTTNASGANINTVGNTIARGAWTSVLDQLGSPGNYGYEFFLSKISPPAAADFLTPSLNASIPLNVGANTFYFFADGNDPGGGSNGFGINLYFDAATSANPSMSGYRLNGTGQSLLPDASTSTASFDYKVIPGTNKLSFTKGNYVVTMSDFVVTAIGATIGGGSAGTSTVDLVNSTNVSPFTPPPHPDGLTDTYGQFTITVTEVPEPSSLALAGIAVATCLVRRSRTLRGHIK